MPAINAWTLLVIAGLAAVTVLARGFFFISSKPWRLPGWALRGLQYAPVAALTAVIAPDILPVSQLAAPWRDARLLAAIAAAAFYFWRRHDGYALTASIGVGLAVFLPLHLGLGW